MSDLLRVCMVSTSARRGGAGRMAATLTHALNAPGIGVRATLFHGDDSVSTGDLIGLRRPGARPINALLARLAGDSLSLDFGVARELVARSREFDIVHLHNLHGYYRTIGACSKVWADVRWSGRGTTCGR